MVSTFNDEVTARLLKGAEEYLERQGCSADCRTVVKVPGAWEIPLAARKLAERGKLDAIVALGALVRGETAHFDVLAAAVAGALAEVGRDCGIPLAFGVLTTDTLDQALARAGSGSSNKGWEAARAALEMVGVCRRLAQGDGR